jgi:hypothetical protein
MMCGSRQAGTSRADVCRPPGVLPFTADAGHQNEDAVVRMCGVRMFVARLGFAVHGRRRASE